MSANMTMNFRKQCLRQNGRHWSTTERAVGANVHLVLHSINKNMAWEPQVTYWQL